MSRRRAQATGFLRWLVGDTEEPRRPGRARPERTIGGLFEGPATRKAKQVKRPRIQTTSGAERRRLGRGEMTLAEAMGLGLIETSATRKGKR